jgi:TrmH family RNA methyltransferase
MVVKSKVKYIASLSHKKQRDAEGVFIAEGPKIINELLSEPLFELVELFAVKEWIEKNNTAISAVINEVDENLLARLSSLATPNQVLGVFKTPEAGNYNADGCISIMLDNIQDPGNMGTIIRCADWFGIDQLMCSNECVDAFNPKTIQATMGSIARVKVFYDDLEQVLKQFHTIPVFAATLSGKNLKETQAVSEGIILIGNESKGINDRLLSLNVNKIKIEGKGKAESLNAAVATGIILSHLVK